jgi:hypothetical protein
VCGKCLFISRIAIMADYIVSVLLIESEVNKPKKVYKLLVKIPAMSTPVG